MAVIKFTKDKPKTPAALKRLIKYIYNPAKTDELYYCGGYNCDPNNAFEDFTAVKDEYNKTDGIQGIHFIQSFSPEDNINEDIALEIAQRLLEFNKFDGFQVAYAVHNDKNHIHTHFVINSVNMNTGLKWHMGINKMDLQPIKDFSDRLCKEYGLKTITEVKIEKGAMSDGEFRRKMQSQSWKYEMYLAVLNIMKRAKCRNEFVDGMNKLGYAIKWEDDKKYVTFTSPDNKKCRNSKLYPQRLFTKYAMENQFQKNIEINAENMQIFIDEINEYKYNHSECKYPISEMRESFDRIQGVTVDEYITENKESLENDIKFRLYRELMFALNIAENFERLSKMLSKRGIDMYVSEDDEQIEFTIENMEFTNEDLYPADKFSKSALSEKLAENEQRFNIRKILNRCLYKAKSTEEFHRILSDNGLELKYRSDDAGFAVLSETGFIYNSNYMKNPDLFTKENLEKQFAENISKSNLSRALFVSSKMAMNMEEFILYMNDNGYTAEETDDGMMYSNGNDKYSEKDLFPNNKYTKSGLEKQFTFNNEKKEFTTAALYIRRISPSVKHFVNAMQRLGFSVDWNDGGNMEAVTDDNVKFTADDIYPQNLFTQSAIQEQCEKNAGDLKLDMFCDFIQILRSLSGQDSYPISAMQNMQDLNGNKLKEYMYHYEVGSLYNKNLQGYLSNTDIER